MNVHVKKIESGIVILIAIAIALSFYLSLDSDNPFLKGPLTILLLVIIIGLYLYRLKRIQGKYKTITKTQIEIHRIGYSKFVGIFGVIVLACTVFPVSCYQLFQSPYSFILIILLAIWAALDVLISVFEIINEICKNTD